MKIAGFQTINSLPALYHEGLDMIVISDLHLGLEGSLTYEGSYIPKFQLADVLDDLETAVEETGASRLLVNGDLKHEFSTTRYSEREEIEEFTEKALELVDEMIVIKGNHDTFLEYLFEEYGIELEEEYLEEGVLFSHGHESVKREDYETLVIGHEHPALVLEDEIGTTEKVDCFLHGKMKNGKNIVVMPAFSKISGGSKVNRVGSKDLLSPVLKNQVDFRKLEAVAVSKEAGLFSFPEIGKI